MSVKEEQLFSLGRSSCSAFTGRHQQLSPSSAPGVAECVWPSGARSDLSVQPPEHSCLSPDTQSPQPCGQVHNAEPETLWVRGGERLAESLGLALPGTP